MAATVQPQQPVAQTTATPNWRARLRKFRKSYTFRVLAQGLLTIWAVTTFTFFLIRLMPGNPLDIKIDQLQRQQGIGYQEALARAASLFGFDPNKPVFEQYVGYLANMLHGDLGESITSPGVKVVDEIKQFLPWTLFSVGLGLLVSFTLGVALGLMMAYWRSGILDNTVTVISSILYGIPDYIIPLLLIIIVGIQWGWFSPGAMRGGVDPSITPGFTLEYIGSILKFALLPVLTYVLSSVGGWVLTMKSSTLSTMGEDYINVAKARGLSERRILTGYVGRNALLPLVTRLAISIGFVVSGSIIVEELFQYPGIGRNLLRAINARDYTTMQGMFLVITIAVVVSNVLADLLFGVLDPRVRLGSEEGSLMFATVASPVGFIIGLIIGFVPLAAAIHYRKWLAGIGGYIACVLSGFACGLLGGIPMMIMATAVVISYAYINRQDPFTSLAKLEDVSFKETNREFFIRQMAGFGDSLRATARMLLRNKSGFIGFLGVMFFIIVSVFGPLFVPYEGQPQFSRRQPGATSLFQGPSPQFPLGLDWQGRSVLSHIVNGGQTLIITSVLAGLMATALAVLLGSLAGLLGGIVDQILSAISNFILTIPQTPLLLVLAGLLTLNSNFVLALLFAALNWPALMRAIRAQVLSLRERDYVEAARALDLGTWHIISREVFPNMISYIAVNMIFSIRAAMYNLVLLVILGLVPLKEPDWGIMIYMGRQQGALFNPNASAMLMAPIIAIAIFQLCLVLFTRSLEEIFNPRLRSGV